MPSLRSPIIVRERCLRQKPHNPDGTVDQDNDARYHTRPWMQSPRPHRDCLEDGGRSLVYRPTAKATTVRTRGWIRLAIWMTCYALAPTAEIGLYPNVQTVRLRPTNIQRGCTGRDQLGERDKGRSPTAHSEFLRQQKAPEDHHKLASRIRQVASIERNRVGTFDASH